MDAQTTQTLRLLTGEFYRTQAESFSQTRTHPWPGWQRCMDGCERDVADGPLAVFDVGCGNLRFERYLATWAHECGRQIYAVALDASPDLLQAVPVETPDVAVELVEGDVLAYVLGEKPVPAQIVQRAPFGLVACFGLMHHVPGRELRLRLLDFLLGCARPKGRVCVSLWNFMSDAGMAARARRDTEQNEHVLLDRLGCNGAALEEGDFLLGWQESEGAVRYCHSFSDADVAELVAHAERAGATLVDRFASDGRTGALNWYLVWEVKG